jgi:hypothetical protein
MNIRFNSDSIFIKPTIDDVSIMKDIMDLYNRLMDSKTLKALVFDMSCSEDFDIDLLNKIFASSYRCINMDVIIYFVNLNEKQKEYISHFIVPENVIIAPKM